MILTKSETDNEINKECETTRDGTLYQNMTGLNPSRDFRNDNVPADPGVIAGTIGWRRNARCVL